MKLFGHQIKAPNIETLVIPRADFDIVFKAQAVMDMTALEALCPLPVPPKVMRPGKGFEPDTTDPDYVMELQNWAEKKLAWLIIESLKVTEGLTWDKVDPNNSNTWTSWQKELKEAFFTDQEIQKVIDLVLTTNGISEKKMEEARARFLSGGLRPMPHQLSQMEDQTSTRSGVPVKDLESSHQV